MQTSSPAISKLAMNPPDLVWFTGTDVLSFLDSLITQDLSSVEEGSVARSMLLFPQGKMDHLLWVLFGAERIGLITDHGRGPDLAAGLARYRIRVDVEIQVEEEDVWLEVGGSPTKNRTWHLDDRLEADISWSRTKRVLRSGPRPELETWDQADLDRMRVEEGEPMYGVDIGESTIPQESELVDETISFSKGCFLGQELVARIDSRGRVNRRLRRVVLEDGALTPGATVVYEDSEVGTLTSAVGDMGLGLLHRSVEPGARVGVGTGVGKVLEAR